MSKRKREEDDSNGVDDVEMPLNDENSGTEREYESNDDSDDSDASEEENVGFFAHKMRERRPLNPNFLAAIQKESEAVQEFWNDSVWKEDEGDGSEYVPEDESEFADVFDSDYDSSMDENAEDTQIKTDAQAQDEALAKSEKGKKTKSGAYIDPSKAVEAELAEAQKNNKFIKRPAWLKAKDNQDPTNKSQVSKRKIIRLDHLWFAENMGPNAHPDVAKREKEVCNFIIQRWNTIKAQGTLDELRDKERQKELLEGIRPSDFDEHSNYLQKMDERRYRRLMPLPRGVLDEISMLKLRREFLLPHAANLYTLPLPIIGHSAGGSSRGRGGRRSHVKDGDGSIDGVFWPSCGLTAKPSQLELLLYAMSVEQKVLCRIALQKELLAAGLDLASKSTKKGSTAGPVAIFNSTLTDRIWHYLEDEREGEVIEARPSAEELERKRLADLAKRRREVEGDTGPYPPCMQSCSAPIGSAHDNTVVSGWSLVLFTDDQLPYLIKEGVEATNLIKKSHIPVLALPRTEWQRPAVELSSRVCAVTGEKARYRDPLSGWGYKDAAAFKELRRRFAAGEILGLGCDLNAAEAGGADFKQDNGLIKQDITGQYKNTAFPQPGQVDQIYTLG